MRCNYCGAEITPGQPRCGRCRGKLTDSPHEPEEARYSTQGALAPEPALAQAPEAPRRLTVTEGGGAVRTRAAVQPPLFPPDSNVVNFDEYRLPEAQRRRTPAQRRTRTAAARQIQAQIAFDFEAAQAGGLGLDRGANRYHVASLGRRAVACAADLALVLAIGVLPFLIAVRGVVAAPWPPDRAIYLALAASCWFIAGIYHMLFAFAGRPSPGQQFTRLRLVTMEGRPGEPKHRVLRVLFYAFLPPACLLGSAWAALTEERFSWADQVSRTYFTTWAPAR